MFIRLLLTLFVVPQIVLAANDEVAKSEDRVICKPFKMDSREQAEDEYQAWMRSFLANLDGTDYIKTPMRIATNKISKSPELYPRIPNWIKTQLGDLSSQYVETSRGKIHYLKGGRGPNVLVFFHGNPTWSFIWRKIISQLNPEKYTFIAPDLLNLGFSDSLPKPGMDFGVSEAMKFNMKNVSEAMSDFIQTIDSYYSLSQNPNVTLVVQDWGGPMGFATAVANPQIYKKMVILNTGVGIPNELPSFQAKAHTPGADLVQQLNLAIKPASVTRLSKVQSNPLSISGTVDYAYQYPAFRYKNLDMAVHYARMVPARVTDKKSALESVAGFEKNEEFLRKFSGPIQVIWGTDDKILGPELDLTVKKILPAQAEYTKVKAGHFLQEECPIEIAEKIDLINQD